MPEKLYHPVFIPIVKESVKQIDLNYFSIRQKMKNIGINTFKSIKQTNKETSDSWQKYYDEMNKCILEFYKKIELMYDRYKNLEVWYGSKKEK